MAAPLFDIFSGRYPGGEEIRWLEAIEGFERACERMNELATATPGAYFIMQLENKPVLAFVDARKVDA